jgi:hypothetical protein
MFAVQFIRGRRPQHEDVDDNDLDWETIIEPPYTTWSAADDAAADYAASFDGTQTFRVVELRVHLPEPVKVRPEFEALRLALTGRA